MQKIIYVGPIESGYVVSPDNQEFHFKKGEPFSVPAALAEILLAQSPSDYQAAE
jgi:hypothetical protein